MATCNVTQLLADGACYTCLDDKQSLAVMAEILCRIEKVLEGETMSECNVNELLADGVCFTCLEPKQMRAVLIQQLCELQSDIASLVADVAAAEAAAAALPDVKVLAYAASVNVDLDYAAYQTVALTGDLTMAATLNRPVAGKSKSVALELTADGSDRTLTFNANWVPIGTIPATITASKVGIVSITALGPNEADVRYAYNEEP